LKNCKMIAITLMLFATMSSKYVDVAKVEAIGKDFLNYAVKMNGNKVELSIACFMMFKVVLEKLG
jgi:hypothetical protein